jgi:hypothetical protein
VSVLPYRPYYYRYRPGISFGFSYGSVYGYPYYGYGYSPYSYAPYGYSPYGYAPYGYAPYGYAAPSPGYLAAVPGKAYGGVRIEGAPPEAEVFADGYYMGIADDFDGALQHMNLETGPHRIEVRAPGYQPIAFDVNVEPGQTITYRALMQPARP